GSGADAARRSRGRTGRWKAGRGAPGRRRGGWSSRGTSSPGLLRQFGPQELLTLLGQAGHAVVRVLHQPQVFDDLDGAQQPGVAAPDFVVTARGDDLLAVRLEQAAVARRTLLVRHALVLPNDVAE